MNLFEYANPGYTDFNSLGLALCGYDIPSQINFRFKIDVSYSQVTNSFVFMVTPSNSTTLFSLNYFLLIANNMAKDYLHIQSYCKS